MSEYKRVYARLREKRRKLRRTLEAKGVERHIVDREVRLLNERFAFRLDAARWRDAQAESVFSPSDAGYRPNQADALLDGPLRVSGNTARAVRRGRTFTKQQLDMGSEVAE